MSAFKPSGRISGMAISEIVQIKQRAAELRAAGREIIDLSIGEPDFDTPANIQAAASEAMRQGETHYTNVCGTPALRAAIAGKMQRDNGRRPAMDEIIACVGAKQVISNAFLATLGPGDEVIIPAPFWSSYEDMVRFAGGVPVIVPCPIEDGYLLTRARLARAVTPRTRWLLLNSPSNPTGAAYDPLQLEALARELAGHPHIWVLEDAIYEHLLYDGGRYCSIVSADPALAERTLWVNGVSKAYAMTGWRIGYGVGPRELIDAMAVVSAQTTSHPCAIAQAAAAAALAGDQSAVLEFRNEFERRRDAICPMLRALPGAELLAPKGAFYAFLNVTQLLETARAAGRSLADDRALAEYLLTTAGVALVPGSAFGAPGHLRLSFAASLDSLLEAGNRLTVAVAELFANQPTAQKGTEL